MKGWTPAPPKMRDDTTHRICR